LLRPPTAADIPAICRLVNDPLIAQFTAAIPYLYRPIEGWRFLAFCARLPETSFSAHFLLALRGSPRHIVGAAGFGPDPDGGVAIGYWIGGPYRRHGFAGEAARALAQRIFTASDAEQVVATVAFDNFNSQRVLKRAGLRRIGSCLRPFRHLRRRRPMIAVAITRKEWIRRKQPRPSSKI
jgi:RimJ/RimL family protein N-acetyltransferase